MNAALRLALSPFIGYAFSGFAGHSVAAPLAFVAGAFPLETVATIFRRVATQYLGLGIGVEEFNFDQVISLDGVDRPTADRLLAADVTTISQLAYCDPVQLTMRTGFAFDYIMDIVSQALAWLYFGEKLALLRPAGLRGAMELYDLLEAAKAPVGGPSRLEADALMECAAKMIGVDRAGFHNACFEAAEDPYTRFLVAIWRDKPDLEEIEEAGE
jgi:hypothetical protein